MTEQELELLRLKCQLLDRLPIFDSSWSLEMIVLVRDCFIALLDQIDHTPLNTHAEAA